MTASPRGRAAGPVVVGLRTRVEHIMGTAVSVAVWIDGDGTALPAPVGRVVEEAFAVLRDADALFSPFRPDSQISRFRDGRLSLDRLHPDVRQVVELCEDLRRSTAGYFDAYAAGPGRLLTTVRGSDVAVATSGTAERGTHVLDPYRHVPAREWASVTIVGESLTLADGYATAAVTPSRTTSGSPGSAGCA